MKQTEKSKMEVTEGRSFNPPPGGAQSPPGQSGGGYILHPGRFASEDILFCIDVGPETMVEMKVNGPNGRPYTRLESIKQAILLFVHAKLTISPDHRFALCALSKSCYWLRKEFSSEVDSVLAALRGISIDSSSSQADLTQLLRVATHEAKKSRTQNRTFRVINLVDVCSGSKRAVDGSYFIIGQVLKKTYALLVLLYCRSSTPPQYQLPPIQKLFTLDVMYLHDKPGPENCPQMVFDVLVEIVERISEFEGYMFESGQGLTRSLFRHMCVLLCHPQQRCLQDEVELPKSLVKKSPAGDTPQGDDVVVVSGQ